LDPARCNTAGGGALTEQKDTAADSARREILLDGVRSSSRARADHQHTALLLLLLRLLARSIDAALLRRNVPALRRSVALTLLLRRHVALLSDRRTIAGRRSWTVVLLLLRELRLLRELWLLRELLWLLRRQLGVRRGV
jgi:hypothetical protein